MPRDHDIPPKRVDLGARDAQWLAALLDGLALLGIDPPGALLLGPIVDPAAAAALAFAPVARRLAELEAAAAPAKRPAPPAPPSHARLCFCENCFPDRAIRQPWHAQSLNRDPARP